MNEDFVYTIPTFRGVTCGVGDIVGTGVTPQFFMFLSVNLHLINKILSLVGEITSVVDQTTKKSVFSLYFM